MSIKQLCVSVVLVALAGASLHTFADSEPGFTVQQLASPAGANSSEPQFTVQGDRAILSWLEVGPKRTTLKFSERTPSGWSTPQIVFSGDRFFVNAFDVPSVRALTDGTLVANWLDAIGAEESDATNVRLSWSKDKGHTWSKPVSPHHDGTQTEHGFVSTFQAPGGGFGLVWIDGRATDPEKETGDMSLRASTYDAAGKQLGETVIDPRVCECCSTSASPTAEGLIVAFRNRSPKEIRDIYVARFVDGHWSMPNVVHDDNWRINACPINGPAISANGRDVVVGWFTGKDDKGRAFAAFSHDGGRTFGQPIRVDDSGSLGRLGAQLLPDGSAAVIDVELIDKHSQLRIRKISPTGLRSGAVNVAQTSGERYPRITRDKDELLLSWTDAENGATHLRTARIGIRGK